MRGEVDHHDPFPESSNDELLERVRNDGNLPRHVAIIMDGNGRWARRRFLPRAAGHRAGRHSVRAAVRTCGQIGVGALTLYTFSQENFTRPSGEVRALWAFLEEALSVEREELRRSGVRLLVSGDIEMLPAAPRRALDEALAYLAEGDGLQLNLALAYGGRQEIVRAARRLAAAAQRGEVDPAAIGEEHVRSGLYHPELPDPDLVIRTSGEHRLSNFLIWQAAYAELYVTSTLWPDFRERQLLLAVADYQRRERRFGGLGGDKAEGIPVADPAIWNPERWKRLLKVRT